MNKTTLKTVTINGKSANYRELVESDYYNDQINEKRFMRALRKCVSGIYGLATWGDKYGKYSGNTFSVYGKFDIS